jgi:hypothetical protein
VFLALFSQVGEQLLAPITRSRVSYLPRIGTDDPASGVFHFSPNVRNPTLSAIFQLRAIFRPTECLTGRSSCLPRAVLRGYETRTRPRRSPFDAPLGIGVLSRRPVPPSATGPKTSVEVAAGPGARRDEGEMRRGQRSTDCLRRSSVSHAVQSDLPTCCRSVSRHDRQGCKRRVRPATLREGDRRLTGGARASEAPTCCCRQQVTPSIIVLMEIGGR